MNVCSIEWVACLLVFSAFFHLIPALRARQIFLGAANIGFIATFMPNASAWGALAGFVALGYGAAVVLRRRPGRGLLVLYLTVVIGLFVICKKYAFIKWALPEAFLGRAIATVGWSYILFRQIQVAVDAAQGQIENLSIWNYLNFQLNVFGFVAGPIQRYDDFCGYWLKLEPLLADVETMLFAILRVFIGALKISVISSVFLSFFNKNAALLTDSWMGGSESFSARLIHFAGLFYAYPIYIYFNFSGYCDMVIGGGLLFGMRMPENFAQPYLSRNMIDFWTRWHRTLGFWIRDYIFTPMYKGIAGRWPKRAPSLAFLCYFGAFFLAGVWHGSTWNFVIYGLLNGLGLAATKLWETFLIKRIGRPGLKNYLQKRRIRVAAIVVTLHFTALTMYFFAMDLGRAWLILKHVFAGRG